MPKKYYSKMYDKNMFKNIGARLSLFIKKIKNNIVKKIIFSKNIFSINNIFKKNIFKKHIFNK